MTKPKTLRELMAEGGLQLRSREAVERTAEQDDAATERWMERTRSAAYAEPRRPGRPHADAPRRETKVRSVRLELPLWDQIDIVSDSLGCSANRFIEEAILNRLYLYNESLVYRQAQTNWTRVATIAMNDNHELKSERRTFQHGIAA